MDGRSWIPAWGAAWGVSATHWLLSGRNLETSSVSSSRTTIRTTPAGLAGLLEWSPEAELGTTEYEAEIISDSRRLDERPNRIVRALDRRLQLSTAPVGKVLREGDLVSGFRVILTPGYTSGHASLLRDEDGLLFAGDAFGAVALRRIRVGVVKIFCTDLSLAKRSAKKLLQEKFDTVVMSHGKPLYTGARQELREAVARCNYG